MDSSSARAAEALRLASGPLEFVGAADVFFDYVRRSYTPTVPVGGKLRSVNLLVESFALGGVEAEGRQLIDQVRERYGRFKTVWGVKLRPPAEIAWELYFYDSPRDYQDLSPDREALHRELNPAMLRDLLAPFLRVGAEEPRPLPWHMVSVEFGPSHLRGHEATTLDLYVDMRSYKVRGSEFAFENVYTFHDPGAAIDEILHRLRSSVHVDLRRTSLPTLLPPELLRCDRVCVANKRASDGLYFSRVPGTAVEWFMERHGWPQPLRSFLGAHAALLDHLLWDVALDFSTRDGLLRVDKTGVYGSL